MRGFFLAFIALIFGCAHADTWRVEDSGRRTVLPGNLDLAVIDGSIIPRNCQLDTILGSRDIVADCVAFPAHVGQDSGRDFQTLYVQALSDRGWRFAEGLANVFYFERPRLNTNCSDRLDFVAWVLGDPDEIMKYGRDDEGSMDWSRVTHVTFIMTVEPAPVCGDDREVK